MGLYQGLHYHVEYWGIRSNKASYLNSFLKEMPFTRMCQEIYDLMERL